jgi:DNA-binding MarR family transcriptional regulator
MAIGAGKQKSKKGSAAYAEHVLDLFAGILHRTITIRPLEEAGCDVTPSLAQGLQFLYQHGVCSVSDIAHGLCMTYSAASQLTDRLVKRDLVSRCENKKDRRLSEIRLTDDGRSAVERIRLHRIKGLTRILQRLETGDREAFIGYLENFIVAAVEDAHGALESCSHCGSEHLPECVINEVYRTATGRPINETWTAECK